jgi:hypothetical protein
VVQKSNGNRFLGYEPAYVEQQFDFWALGGGRTLRANATKRFLAETGFARKVDKTTKVVGRGVESALGEAECAAIQTVHFADSAALEW